LLTIIATLAATQLDAESFEQGLRPVRFGLQAFLEHLVDAEGVEAYLFSLDGDSDDPELSTFPPEHKTWEPGKLEEKMAENPNLWNYETDPGKRARLSFQKIRKLNRISGRLQRGSVAAYPRASEIAEAIDHYILYGTPKAPLTTFWFHADAPSEQQYYLNSHLLLSMKLTGASEAIVDEYTVKLKEQWRKRNFRVQLAIVAHRGDGATFEKAGTPFARADFNWPAYKHQNENSRPAVLKALRGWKAGRLDGVETDIAFTKDGVPFMEHTRETDRLDAQERNRRVVPPEGGRALNEIESRELSRRHMSLKRWLQTIRDFVTKHDEAISDDSNLRLEIEMKDPPLWFCRDRRGHSLTDDEVLAEWRRVQKEVSRFLKREDRPSLYQVAFFNGSFSSVAAGDQLAGGLKTLAANDVVFAWAGPRPFSLKPPT
jgi:glycerophosphoryl diester phosphodiesterase